MKNLKKYFWEYKFKEEELQKLLSGEVDRIGHLSREGLYSRILMSEGWYNIVEIIGLDKLNEALSEGVLKKIKSADLKRRLRIAKRILFE